MKRTEQLCFRTGSASETEALGRAVGGRLRPGMCLALVGGLGAGKTVLVRGICRGLGVDEDVLSPTFILCEEFAGRLPVIHVDLYRLDHESEIEQLGIYDRLGGDAVLLVEWGDRSSAFMEAADAVVTLVPDGDEARRVTVEVTAEGKESFEGLEQWSP